MADFSQANAQGQLDPDMVRKAILAKLFGDQPQPSQPVAPGATPPAPGQPSNGAPAAPGSRDYDLRVAATNQPKVPMFTPQDATPPDLRGGSPPAQPLSLGPQPPGARTSGGTPAGMTRPPSISDPEATNASTRPLPSFAPVLSEADYAKQNPAPAHTPYVPPDLKHRVLKGIFAGMQEFGRPGEGAATVRDYLGNIQQKEDAEKAYPANAAAAAHNKYMTYVAGAKVPIDLENMKAELDDRYAQADERRARAAAAANPRSQLQHVVIADPKTGDPIPAAFDRTSGKYLDTETGEPIAGAKAWERKPADTPFAVWRQQHPNDDVSEYFKLQPEARNEVKPPKEAPHLTPGQKGAANRRYQKALDDIETESRARASGTFVHPRSGELMPPMTEDELTQRKQRADDEYKDELEAGGDPNVQRFNYRTGTYEGGTAEPAKPQAAKPQNAARSGAGANAKDAPPPQHQVNDEVMYQGKRHKITAIANGKAVLQPLE